MTHLVRAYDLLVVGLAVIAGAILPAFMLIIVYQVVWRNLGLQPSAHLFTFTEYGLLYLTMLGAPWLVRERGHVYIEVLTAYLPVRARNALSRIVSALCVVISGVLALKGLDITLTNFASAEMDVRSLYFPRWILIACIPLGFGLMAVEFARFVFGAELFHSGEAGIHE
ncbi:TRAP transporter small permease [Acuticoccus sp. MNP-M23]|uniref:TRAP transporter small permease n=1 Tax=Acuticoccus sp. MNP-M23 TaxID=3072793 RepID=UPI002814A224|nr:TRAP transporter small permease [Acuticoccus sp. MNP-M23]WMS41458.1 TRAP transporter small permease [Acuticoccus sp. MNP-M23]